MQKHLSVFDKLIVDVIFSLFLHEIPIFFKKDVTNVDQK